RAAARAGPAPADGAGTAWQSSRRYEVQARTLAPLPFLVEDRGVTGVLDLPRAADAHVVVEVEGADAHAAVLPLVEHVVVERPAAAGGVGTEEVDLGLQAVVDADRPRVDAEGLAQELDDRRHPLKAVLAVRALDGGVGREALGHLVPALLVEAAPVLVLEPSDRLEVLEALQAGRELFQGCHTCLLYEGASWSTSEPRSSSRSRVWPPSER